MTLSWNLARRLRWPPRAGSAVQLVTRLLPSSVPCHRCLLLAFLGAPCHVFDRAVCPCLPLESK